MMGIRMVIMAGIWSTTILQTLWTLALSCKVDCVISFVQIKELKAQQSSVTCLRSCCCGLTPGPKLHITMTLHEANTGFIIHVSWHCSEVWPDPLLRWAPVCPRLSPRPLLLLSSIFITTYRRILYGLLHNGIILLWTGVWILARNYLLTFS